MRQIFKGALALAAMAAPVAAQAAPDAGTVKDMACFVMMGKLAAAPDSAKLPVPAEVLKVSTGFFGGKVATRYPGQNMLTVINNNRDAVNGALAKPDPGVCLREVQVAMAAPGSAAKK